MILEIDAQGWVLIIGAVASAATVIGAAVVGVIMALNQLNRKIDEAAERREEIAVSPQGAPKPPAGLVPPERPIRMPRGRRP